jgi:hypothetical protein
MNNWKGWTIFTIALVLSLLYLFRNEIAEFDRVQRTPVSPEQLAVLNVASAISDLRVLVPR